MTKYSGKLMFNDLKDPVLKDIIAKELTENYRKIIDTFYENLIDQDTFSSKVLRYHICCWIEVGCNE